MASKGSRLNDRGAAKLRKQEQSPTSSLDLNDRIRPGKLDPQIDAIRHGDHLCSIHVHDSEQLRAITPFLKEGLRRGEACCYISQGGNLEVIADKLKAAGVDVRRERARGALTLASRRQWQDLSDTNLMGRAPGLREFIEHHLAQGFPGLWMAADMAWVHRARLGASDSPARNFLAKAPVVLLCLCDLSRLGPWGLIHGLHTHPIIISGDRVQPNLFYEPRSAFPSKAYGTKKLDRMFEQFRLAAAREDALRNSEEQFRLLAEGAKDCAIIMLDPKGYIRSRGLGAEQVHSYFSNQIIAKHFSIFYPNEDIQSGKPKRLLKQAGSLGRAEDECWMVREDGSRFWAHVMMAALRDESGELRGFAEVVRDVTERKSAEDTLRQVSGQLLHVQDEERRRLARELHDSTAQVLAALSLNLAIVKECVDASGIPRASAALSECIALADQASDEVRNFSHLLHPPLLEQTGLVKALEWYVHEFARRTGVKADLKISPNFGRIPIEMETTIFRIVQESLTNIHRHSGSPTAELRLLRNGAHVVLEVVDRGKGLPRAIEQPRDFSRATPGIGIQGMRERVRQLGGFLELGSANPGTWLRALLPLPSPPPRKSLTH